MGEPLKKIARLEEHMQEKIKLMSFGGRLMEESIFLRKDHSILLNALSRSIFIVVRPDLEVFLFLKRASVS